MRRTYWKSGEWSAICDVCGLKFKASSLQRRWDGLQVCTNDFEVRHPQELIRAIPDQNKLTWTRPEPEDTFILSCTVTGREGVAGKAVAGCSITARNLGY